MHQLPKKKSPLLLYILFDFATDADTNFFFLHFSARFLTLPPNSGYLVSHFMG